MPQSPPPAPSSPAVVVVDERNGPLFVHLDGRDIEHESWGKLAERGLRLWIILTGVLRGRSQWCQSRERLAEMCRMSVSSVDRATAELEQLGYIKRVRRHLPVIGTDGRPIRSADGELVAGFQVANVYRLRSPCERYPDAGLEVREIVSDPSPVRGRILATLETRIARDAGGRSSDAPGGRSSDAHSVPVRERDPEQNPPSPPSRGVKRARSVDADLVAATVGVLRYLEGRWGSDVWSPEAHRDPRLRADVVRILRGEERQVGLGMGASRSIPRQYAGSVRERDIPRVLELAAERHGTVRRSPPCPTCGADTVEVDERRYCTGRCGEVATSS